MKPVWPRLTTPDQITPSLVAFAVEINGTSSIEHVEMAKYPGPLQNCYWNVNRAVEDEGGVPCLGWLLLWWPNLFFEAMHHCVWRSPDGGLIDVTQKLPTDEIESYSLFLPDETISIDLQRAPSITSRHHAILDIPEVHDYFEKYRIKDALQQKQAQVFWEAGYRGENQFAMAAGKELQGFDFDQTFLNQLAQIDSIMEGATLGLGSAINALVRIEAERQ